MKSTTEINEFTENIFNTVREPLLVLDKDLRAISANQSFYNFFKVSEDEIIGILIYDLGNHHWEFPKLKELFEKILPKKKSVDNYEVEHDFTGIGNRTLILNARQIESTPEKDTIILIAMEDITELKLAEEKMQESEEIYRELVEASPDGIIIQQEGKIVFANRSSTSLMRASSIDELIGKSVIDFVHPSYKEIVIDKMIAMNKTGKALPFAEEIFLRLDASEVDVEVKAIPIVFDNKPAVQIIVRDITERKQIESALKTSEERFRTAAGTLTDVVYEWDINQKLDWYGDIDGITGYPLGGFPRTFEAWSVIVHPEDKDRVMEALENHFKNRVPFSVDYRTKRMDGEWRWWSARGTALRDDNGEPYKMIGSITDITERKDIQNRIKFKSDLLSHIGQAVVATDLQGSVIYWNKGAEEIYGWSSAEAMGKSIVALTPTEHAKEYAIEIMKALSEGKSWSGEFLVKRKDGSIFPAYVTDTPIIDSDGKLIGIIGISNDITERKQAEEALQESEKRYRQVIENASDIIFTTDLKGNILFGNNAALNISGYSLEEFTKLNYLNLALPEFKRKIQFFYLRQFKNKLPTSRLDFPLKNKFGDIVWLGLNSNLIFENDKIIGFHIVGRDITERKLSMDALHTSEAKFRSYVNDSPQGIFVVNAKGQYIDANNAALNQIGCSKEYLLQKTIADFLPKEELENGLNHFNKLVKEGKATSELGLLKSNGEKIYVILDTVKISNDHFLGFSTDITERKQAAETLSNERTLLRTIIDLIPDAIYAVDIEGRKILANAKEIELCGKNSEDEIIGKTDFDLYPESQAQRYYEEDQIIIRSGKPALYMEDTLKGKDGQIHWLLGSKVPLRDVHGQITGIVGVNHDITERKLAEELLSESHQIIEGIINTIPVRVFWKDKNLIYLGCNNLFAQDAGFTNPEEIIGKNDFQMAWHSQAELYRADDHKVIESSTARLLVEEPQTTPDGNVITLLTSKIPMVNSAKETIGILGTYIDISDRKRAEEEIKKSHEELVKLNAQKDKFFSIIAHDLKSPFNGLVNLTALMADTAENFSLDEFVEYSKMLNKTAGNIYTLLDNLLEWSQIQKGSISFNPKIYDLLSMVSQSIETIYQDALNKRITIINEINYPQNVYADEKSISTVIRNLLTNAVKFTRMDGKVVVKSRRIDEDTLQVSIQDNGVGISDEDVKKLFRIEEKVSSLGTEGEPSTGLGLLLCKEFVEMHGQKIWVESEKNKGSTFSFTLKEENGHETK
ncbi:MAG TPA: hypothetical protein DHV28_04310 [Ignavibacteriales bacterium]|nr:hypothetical protein [Ignavibacteriales bacterium]